MQEKGFTLVEVLVALGILCTGGMAVAQLLVVTTSSIHTARVQTSTTLLSAARLEELKSLRWGFDSAGSPVTDLSTNLAAEPRRSDGAGLSISPPGSLDQNTAGYVDYLDASGRWLAAGPAPPAAAAYVRRWSIERPSDGAADTLVLHVLTRSMSEDAGNGPTRPAVAPGEARLTTLLTRVAP